MKPFTSRRSQSVAALGEEKLISALRGWLGTVSPPSPRGIGDDCAVLPPAARPQLLTVDPVVYGRHFDHRLPPSAVAAKLLKRNLSDLAAMGARPSAAVIALTLDPRVRIDWLKQFYHGLAASARRYRVPIVGGDIAQAGGILAASLTLLGIAAGPRVLTRKGAQVGDWIYVTGVLGNSLASGHHWKFEPRLAEGAWLAREKAVRSLMDISDGLAKDLHALTPPGSEAALTPSALPRRPGVSLRSALSEGEDYELAFSVAGSTDREGFARKWKRAFPRVRLSCIGRFVRHGALPPEAIRLGDYHGYAHLS